MVLREQTPLDGGLLDHVYIHKMFLRKKEVNAIVKNVSFTDHDAVKIILNHSDSEVDFQIFS